MSAPKLIRYGLGGFLVGAAALSFSWLGSTLTGARAPADPSATSGLVYRVPVTGVVELGLAPFLERSIREARDAGADAVVFEIDTPGGRVDAAQRIVAAVQDAELPVYAFVNRTAFSAGALIALATNEVFMRPGAVMGAVTPVGADGVKASEKMVSAMRAEMRALAEARGLDPLIAEAMVDEELAIDGVVEAGKLLTLTSDEAVRFNFAREVEDWDALLAALGLEQARVQATTTNWAESVVRFLTHPAVAPMLLSLGFLGLLIEIKTPGMGIPGLAGAVSLGLFFGSHFLIGLAGWEELMLLIAGVALLGVELFIIPGFGVAGVAGIIAILASIYMTLLTPLAGGAEYAQAAALLSLSLIVVIIAAWALVRRLPTSTRFAASGLMLGETETREGGYLSQPARPELLGATGIAVTDLRPAGTARFGEERFDVVADATWIGAGTPVRIVRSDGYRLVVQQAEPSA
jgi:membrane-bound serine protease (ClpP class)